MRAEIRALLPAGVEGSERLGREEPGPLFPEELAGIAKAVEKRRREFALGRTCARDALGAIGVAAVALPSLADRSVAWPAGFLGSITHADGYVAAIASSARTVLGLGIDAEVKDRVQEKLWTQIANPSEIAWFESATDESEARVRATRLFSAKEAFYKAQYCISRAWVGFHDVNLTFANDTFEVELTVDVEGLSQRGARYRGKYVTLDEHVITTLVILPG